MTMAEIFLFVLLVVAALAFTVFVIDRLANNWLRDYQHDVPDDYRKTLKDLRRALSTEITQHSDTRIKLAGLQTRHDQLQVAYQHQADQLAAYQQQADLRKF